MHIKVPLPCLIKKYSTNNNNQIKKYSSNNNNQIKKYSTNNDNHSVYRF
jgi:hypothetical protein